MALIEKIGNSFAEQISTTAETMRRRGLEIYDLGERCIIQANTQVERAHVWAIGTLKTINNDDLKQKVLADILDYKNLDQNEDKTKRDSVQELYFGTSILMLALGAGQATGVSWSASLSSVFSPSVEFALLFVMMPTLAYYRLKNFSEYDDIQRRNWLYAFIFCVGVLLGDLFGVRLIATSPTLFFLPPLITALTMDAKLSPKLIWSNRGYLLTTIVIGSFLIMKSLSFVTGAASMMTVVLQCVVIATHFQLTMAHVDRAKLTKDGKPGINEIQIFYVLAVVLIAQLPLALLFGKSTYGV